MPAATSDALSSLLSADQVEYDFEEYAVTHGIPKTLDPLPYRKTGSVFGSEQQHEGAGEGGEETAAAPDQEVVLTSAKHDPRLRTVVCRHWLRDLCMKGAACEFLHQFDLAKMPLCRHGERCKIPACPFRHVADAHRMDCVFYSQGFCLHGNFCRYRHAQRPREDLPAVADFTLGLSQMQQHRGDDEKQQRSRPAAKPNEFYKISLCKHFIAGDCPFGEGCHFAHGEHELRQYPRKEQESSERNLSETMFASTTDGGTKGHGATADYFQGSGSGGGKPCPILEPDQAAYFIVRASALRDLAISTVRGEWYLQRKHAEVINKALSNGKRQVLLFFTVSESRHIQGAALVLSQATPAIKGAVDDASFSYCLPIEWYRTTELPIATALQVAPDLLLPTASTQYCQDIPPATGESLMKAVWNSPVVTLYESWAGDDDDDMDTTDKEPPAADALLTDFRAPAPDEMAWPTSPGPGFIFGCSSDTMDECLGRGILGLPAHMQSAASCIDVGTTLFLFNVTDRLLFGIFEALTPTHMNLEPAAFSKNPKATSSPFPVQIRFRVSLECPPLEDNDPLLNQVLRARGKSRIGPLTQAQTEAVASLLASQCGALQYMMDYERGLVERRQVRAPPIALPPRTIVRKTKSDANGGSNTIAAT